MRGESILDATDLRMRDADEAGELSSAKASRDTHAAEFLAGSPKEELGTTDAAVRC